MIFSIEVLLVARVSAQNGSMSTKASTLKSVRRFESPDIPMSAIRRYVRQVIEKFQPDKVILFGSYARGDQREGSDVDLLVVMPAWNEISKASRISWELPAPFTLDLIVRTPKHLQRGLEESDWFLRDIMETGKVLYAASNGAMGPKSRSRLARSTTPRRRTGKTQ